MKIHFESFVSFVKLSITEGLVSTAKSDKKNTGILVGALLVLLILPFMFGGGSSSVNADGSPQYSSDANTPASELNTDPYVRGKFSKDLKFPYGQFFIVDNYVNNYYYLDSEKLEVWLIVPQIYNDKLAKSFSVKTKKFKSIPPSDALLRSFKKGNRGKIVESTLLVYKGISDKEEEELVLIKALKDGKYSYWAIIVMGKYIKTSKIIYQ